MITSHHSANFAFVLVCISQIMEDESVRLTLMANSSGYSTFKGLLVFVACSIELRITISNCNDMVL